jgi:hypothetical protein
LDGDFPLNGFYRQIREFSVSDRWASLASVVWRAINGKSGLAAVGECALPGGFRATVFTLAVGVIDVAVLVVARVQAIDALVL